METDAESSHLVPQQTEHPIMLPLQVPKRRAATSQMASK